MSKQCKNKKICKKQYKKQLINPLGDWTGGTNVDSGATNRKLRQVIWHNRYRRWTSRQRLIKSRCFCKYIYAFLKAQETLKPIELFCAIGDEFIDGKPYNEIVEIARDYISKVRRI